MYIHMLFYISLILLILTHTYTRVCIHILIQVYTHKGVPARDVIIHECGVMQPPATA